VKAAGIQVRIGRLVVDASRRGEAAGLSDAIGQALRLHLAGDCAGADAADRSPRAGVPHAIARRIATRLAETVPGSGTPRGKP
jgi:hypothetical protein